MRLLSRRLSWSTVSAFGALILIGVTQIPAPARAAATPQVTVSPNFSLIDGQQVVVRWSGFSKGGIIWIHVCEKGATDVARCASRSQTPDRKSDIVSTYSISDASGAGAEAITVAITDANHGLAGAPDVKCDVNNPCDVVVNESWRDLGRSVRTTIKFAPSAVCPDPGELRATGVGSDASELALEEWSSSLCRAPYNVALGYSAKNDVSGRSDYQCLKVDFAVVEYLPDYENDSCPATTPGGRDSKRPVTRLAPITLSPVVIAFNMRDQQLGTRIDKLVLSPQLLAEIFTGKLYSGQDARIKRLNPKVNLPANIRAIARADQAGINYTLTRFLSAYAPAEYKAGGKLFQYGPTDSLANVNGLDLRTGGTYVAKGVLYPENDPRTTPWGFLGVMDASTAARFGLSTVTLAMVSSGKSHLVAPTQAATLAALQGLKADRYGYTALPARLASVDAWPMLSIGYVVPPASDAGASSQAAVASMVRYAISDGQKSGMLPAGYVPLPESLKALAIKAVSAAGPDEEQTTTPSQAPEEQSTVAPSGQVDRPDVSPGNSSAETTVRLASVFDRPLAGGAATWLWLLLIAGAAVSAVHLIRSTGGTRS